MLEFFINLDRNSIQPLFEQVYKEIRNRILTGDLQNGQKLPSVRKMAIDLGVGKNTILHAYELLLAEGLISSKPQSGYMIDFQDEMMFTESKHQQMTTFQSEGDKEEVIDFYYGNIESEDLPYSDWKQSFQKTLDQNENTLLSLSNVFGEAPLREQIKIYVETSRGVKCDVDEIMIGGGIQQILFFLASIFKLEGIERVAVEEPTYNKARHIFGTLFQAPSLILSEEIDWEGLHSYKPQAIYVHTSHRGTETVIMSLENRLDLLNWAKETGSYIIEDDFESEFRNLNEIIPSIKTFDEGRNHVIYMGTLSSTLSPFAKISYMVFPKRLMQTMYQYKGLYEQPVSKLMQLTIAEFMKAGFFGNQLRRMRKKNALKLEAFKCCFEEYFQDRVHIFSKDAGIHLLAEIKVAKTEEQLVAEAERVKVRVYPTKGFWKNPAHRYPVLQFGFSGVPIEKMREVVQKLADIWLDEKK
ncbi:MocR-like pyridoxine biosynthesis transcription factor PdxR [Neobacillus dielmonensis]|uniref:MocR-like pyridoxine biosynthesis transcription factor PdxR n=1 Tax=Neobacillus dielmonensis TaxID=1347369 RepID=UPI0005AB791A|nr:PLP-dependent aminotransferase family protein [Neobacillus dielmonensis]